MLLTNTLLENTKKFFTKTFRTFKSFVSSSGGRKQYQKLPKNSTTCTTIQGDEDDNHAKGTHHRSKSLVIDDKENYSSSIIKTAPNDQEIVLSSAPANIATTSSSQGVNKRRVLQGEDENGYERFSKDKKLEIKQKMIKKLGLADKEMIVMRNDHKEYVMDVQEMLHYYSHITCPSYLDILDKFLMELTYNSEYHQHHASSMHPKKDY
ncbi:uncharacterized protein LOC113306650 [Papaver somniferum]|uniref:uncharacterized protein LOC113306650 n=1 Tax=Papaver somniferum TaxID=3469 RepID=UPI000E6FD4C3|nr:uncharacterized protein LOC113306650 [Papaver somniferum]